MIQLRPYQIDTINQLSEGFKKHKRQIMCLPTGAGKSVVFSEIVRRAAEKGTKTIICTHRLELLAQTFAHIGRSGVAHQVISADHKIISDKALITVAMAETLKRRAAKGFNIDPKLLVIDECHIKSFNTIMDMYPNARVLGCSATPDGNWLHKYYTNLIHPIDVPDLIQQGFLSPCKGYEMRDDFSDLEIKGDDYSESSQYRHFNTTKLYKGVIEEYMKRTAMKKAIVYNCNIEHANNMNAAFNAAGIRSEVITSNTPPDERKRILKAYEQGLFPVLNNAQIMTTGNDIPSVEVIVVNRATTKLSLWLQIVGRGGRVFPGKTHFTTLDFGGNFSRHGLWDEAREWSLIPPKKRKPKEQPAPVKSCPQCSAIVSARATVCQYCGHVFPEAQKELKEGVMVEVKHSTPNHLVGKMAKDLTLDEIIELQKSKKWKATYCWRIVRNHGEEAIREYAAKMGYTSGWIQNQIKDMANSGFRNYVLK